MADPRVTIKIPRQLYNKIGEVIADSGFSSPTDFIVFVLRDLVGGASIEPSRDGESPEEIHDIRQKLKNLGYLE